MTKAAVVPTPCNRSHDVVSHVRWLIQPVDLHDFLTNHYARAPLVVRAPPEKYNNLFNWCSLEAILNRGAVPGGGVKLNLAGRFLPTNSHSAVLSGLGRGATLIFENVDRHDFKLGRFTDAFSHETFAPCRFNLYASPVGQQGYKIHYDTHDVFILQAEGKKEWHVFPPTLDQPLYFQKIHGVSPPPAGKDEFVVTLDKGDLLYIPKGHWHYAIANDRPSLHLTLAWFTRTGIDLLIWLVDELRDTVSVRQEIFPPLDEQETDQGEHKQAFAGVVQAVRREMLALLDSAELRERFYDHVVASAKNRHPYSLPAQIDDDETGHQLGVAYLRHPHPYTLRSSGQAGALELVIAGKRYDIHAALAPLVRTIFSGDQISQEEILSAAPGVSVSRLGAFIRELVRDGILTDHPGSPHGARQ